MLELDIKKAFGGFTLRAKFRMKNEMLVLLGENGSGKTSTLKAIAGLLTPDEGYIKIEGIPVFDSMRRINAPPQKRRVGFVFQDLALFPHMSVYENIAYGLKARKMGKDRIREEVEGIMEVLTIAPLKGMLPGELSGGQQQKVAIARTLITRPRVLLMDEPFSALDQGTKDRVRREIKTILENFPVPTILVTHDYRDAEVMGGRVCTMEGGKVQKEACQGGYSRLNIRARQGQPPGNPLPGLKKRVLS